MSSQKPWKQLIKKPVPASLSIEDPLLRSDDSIREEEESPRDSGFGSPHDFPSEQGPGSPSSPSCSSTAPLIAENILNGPVISFRNIQYEVEVSVRGTLCRKFQKRILHSVSGIFKSGVNAILGPTGSGKTTLLDILSGRKTPRDDSGPILIDGRKQPKNFKLISGYVKQNDVLMGTLTVHESLMFSALLRLPPSLSYARKKRRVEETILELGLKKCANTKIGNEYLRGVSGGERKRTSIGMELIVSPNILFLDEPTTGLDGSTAMAVISLLHRLSRRGRTIVFSIHQPRYRIFRQFDRLMLLGAGRPIFHGPADEALLFFNYIGYDCERHNNPPDFFLDVINGDIETAVVWERRDARSGSVTSESSRTRDRSRRQQDQTNVIRELADRYRESCWCKSISQELDERISSRYSIETMSGSTNVCSTKFPNSFQRQLRCLSKRTVLNLIRNPFVTLAQTMVSLAIAISIGVIYWQLTSSSIDGLQNRHGAFFFLAICLCFSNLSSMEVFINDLVIFAHESTSGYYRVSAYFFSKVFCDVIPMRIIPTTVAAIITYCMIGLESEFRKFFVYYLTLHMASMAFTSIGYFVGSLVRTFGIANIVLGSLFFFMMFFAGLLINLTSMSQWIRWLKYISIVHYTVNVLLINEVKNKTFYDSDNPRSQNISGSDYLRDQGIEYETTWDLWQNITALGAMSLILLFLTFLRLLRIGHLKMT